MLVLDAGSSGTRLHDFELAPGAATPTLVADRAKKVRPGLSVYAEAPERVANHIGELLDTEWLKGLDASTPVLLRATAGLRALPPGQASALIDAVRAALSKSGFRFEAEWAAIASGREEAGWAWVACNLLSGAFEEGETRGIIEMGGGSSQVAMEAYGQKVAEADRFEFSTLTGRTYAVYAHSYQGFGLDYAQKRLQSELEELEDPCYQTGYSRPGLYSGTLVQGVAGEAACEELVRQHLFQEEDAPGQYKAELPLHGRFVATETFFYVRNDFAIPMNASASAMQRDAETWCRSPLEVRSSEVTSERLCFSLVYQAVFLEVLGASGAQIEILHDIDGNGLDWALGLAIQHSIDEGMFRSSSRTGQFLSLVLVALLCLCASVLCLRRLTVASSKFPRPPAEASRPVRIGTSQAAE